MALKGLKRLRPHTFRRVAAWKIADDSAGAALAARLAEAEPAAKKKQPNVPNAGAAKSASGATGTAAPKAKAVAKAKGEPADPGGDSDSDSSSAKATLQASDDGAKDKKHGKEPAKAGSDSSDAESTDADDDAKGDGDGSDTDDDGDEDGSEEIGVDMGKCTECLEEVRDDQEKARNQFAHKVCVDACRAACHALKQQTKNLKKFKACKKSDPHAYARAIKALRKNPDDKSKRRRSTLQLKAIDTLIENVSRVKTMTRDEGQVLRPKSRFIKHLLNAEHKMTDAKALAIWKDRKKNGYSEWVNGQLEVALPKDTELNKKDGIEVRKTKHIKDGDDRKAAFLELAKDLKGFIASGSNAILDIVGSGSRDGGRNAREKRSRHERKSRSRSRSRRRRDRRYGKGARSRQPTTSDSSSDSSPCTPKQAVKVDSSDSDDKEESESAEEESDDDEPKRQHRGKSHAEHGVPHMLKIIPNCFDPSCRFAF